MTPRGGSLPRACPSALTAIPKQSRGDRYCGMSTWGKYEGAWLAVQVRANCENPVAGVLRAKGYEVFLPLYPARSRKIRAEKLRPLFAGYVFCRFSSRTSWPIISTKGVIRIVGSGSDPWPLDDTEIEAIQLFQRARLYHEPCAYMTIGAVVRICAGPLAGLSGRVMEVKRQKRLVVSVTGVQRSVSVEIDEAWLSPTPVPNQGVVQFQFRQRKAGQGLLT